jgi:RNA polymerase sigma factor (sigma-70 family)
VLAYCRRSLRDPGQAEDLCQRVAIRAWRGYPTFRGDSAFLTWVVRIAEREAGRMQAAEARRQRSEVVLGPDAVLAAPDRPERTPELGWLRDMVDHAGRAGVITEVEARVVCQRLDDPDAPWQRIGDRLSITAAACAVAHCRAVPKLRVLLFLRHQDALGGREAIAAAFQRATDALSEPLSPAEREAFEVVVLQGRSDYRRRGWQANLRRACGLVVRQLDPGAVAGTAW